MEVFNKKFEDEDLELINQCRLYLEATTIADLTSLDGTKILEEVWSVKRTESFK